MMSQLLQILQNPDWLTVVFAALTLLVLCIYTYFTWRVAKATWETLRHNMRPIVSCELRSGKNYYSLQEIQNNFNLTYDTRCIVSNHSKYNVKVFVNLNIKINNKLEEISEEYAGKKGWPITSFQIVDGHFNLADKFNLQNIKSLTINIDISYMSDDGKVYKNPIQYWHFDMQEKAWINDIGVRN